MADSSDRVTFPNRLFPSNQSKSQAVPIHPFSLPWIQVAPHAPYFLTDQGENWTPIGQNDAITWPDLAGLFRRKDVNSVDQYFSTLVSHGVTCLRLMLEYCHTENRYLERPAGVFQPNIIMLWDDVFALCAKHGLRILLTPYDTFWMRKRWAKHPYNRANGGFCQRPSQWLTCPATLSAIKARLAFATRRWGSSGALFAWDLWNEIDPAHAGHDSQTLHAWVSEMSRYLRELEMDIHGRAHLQTVSVYSPVLKKHPDLSEVIFRHPLLDFASVHFYDASIRLPSNTVKPALQTGVLTREALRHIRDGRPFLDSEHGPDRSFRRKQGTLPACFDDQYFRHMQWAHLAAGGAGGGFRWPYRHPHVLTQGMRQAQKVLAAFIQDVDWQFFSRTNLDAQVKISPSFFKGFACGNEKQVILWFLQTKDLTAEGLLHPNLLPQKAKIRVSAMEAGLYSVVVWNTLTGERHTLEPFSLLTSETLTIDIPAIAGDAAMLISKLQ
ncbi:MAG: hypothetical protein V4714_11765 [Bacteroidota bacterium]